MGKVQDTLEPVVSETENIIQEYQDRIKKALEVESHKMKERAEHDSNQILTRAKDDATKLVAQARQSAAAESERILAKAGEEAERTTRESREEASEESARILDEAKRKASQLVMEVVEYGTKQAQSEFARAASEARNKTSRLLTQVSTTVEEIIAEAEASLKAELERLASVTSQAENNLMHLGEMHNKDAKVNSRRATREETTPKPPIIEKREAEKPTINERPEPANPPVVEKKAAPGKQNDDARLFKGVLKVEVIPTFDQEQTGGVPEWLAKLHGLKIISTGGYSGTNRWITTYTVNLDQPLPLLKIFRALPQVKYVAESKGNIVITLK